MFSSSVIKGGYDLWLQSAVFAFMRSVYHVFSRAFANSTIVHWFVRDSRLELIYANSLFARLFKWVLDKIIWLLDLFFAAFERAAEGSITAAFLKRFVNSSFLINYETIFGGFVFLMFIIPHQFWSNQYAVAASLGLFAIYLLMVGAGHRKLYYPHNMGFPIMLFAIACVFSLAFSYVRHDTLRVLFFYIAALFFLFTIPANFTSKERLMKLLAFIYFAVIIMSLLGIAQRILGIMPNASFTDLNINRGVPGRVYSSFDNPNNYAQFIVLMTPLAAVFAANAGRKWLRFPLCVGIVFPAIALIMTYSRSSWISMLLTCIVFVYYADKKHLPALFLAGVVIFPLMPDSVMIRIASLFDVNDTSNAFRLLIWGASIEMARDYFLTGIGLGPESFAYIYPEYAHRNARWGVPHSHMVYMGLIIELGILGFLSFMWYMLRLWKDSACAILSCSDRVIKLMLAACIASLVGISFAFAAEYVWYYPRVFFTYFILAGITTAAIRIQKSQLEVSS